MKPDAQLFAIVYASIYNTGSTESLMLRSRVTSVIQWPAALDWDARAFIGRSDSRDLRDFEQEYI